MQAEADVPQPVSTPVHCRVLLIFAQDCWQPGRPAPQGALRWVGSCGWVFLANLRSAIVASLFARLKLRPRHCGRCTTFAYLVAKRTPSCWASAAALCDPVGLPRVRFSRSRARCEAASCVCFVPREAQHLALSGTLYAQFGIHGCSELQKNAEGSFGGSGSCAGGLSGHPAGLQQLRSPVADPAARRRLPEVGSGPASSQDTLLSRTRNPSAASQGRAAGSSHIRSQISMWTVARPPPYSRSLRLLPLPNALQDVRAVWHWPVRLRRSAAPRPH